MANPGNEIEKQINDIFKAYWDERDINCKSESCVWVNSKKLKEKIIELLKEQGMKELIIKKGVLETDINKLISEFVFDNPDFDFDINIEVNQSRTYPAINKKRTLTGVNVKTSITLTI